MIYITKNRTFQKLEKLGFSIEIKRRPGYESRLYVTKGGKRITIVGEKEGGNNKTKYVYEDIPRLITINELIMIRAYTIADKAMLKLVERITKNTIVENSLIELF